MQIQKGREAVGRCLCPKSSVDEASLRKPSHRHKKKIVGKDAQSWKACAVSAFGLSADFTVLFESSSNQVIVGGKLYPRWQRNSNKDHFWSVPDIELLEQRKSLQPRGRNGRLEPPPS